MGLEPGQDIAQRCISHSGRKVHLLGERREDKTGRRGGHKVSGLASEKRGDGVTGLRNSERDEMIYCRIRHLSSIGLQLLWPAIELPVDYLI